MREYACVSKVTPVVASLRLIYIIYLDLRLAEIFKTTSITRGSRRAGDMWISTHVLGPLNNSLGGSCNCLSGHVQVDLGKQPGRSSD